MPTDLAALSAAATQGMWYYRPLEHDDWGLIRGEEDDHWGWVSRPIIAQFRGRQDEEELSEHRRAKTDPWKDNPLFVCALVNAYRTGNLVQIDRDGMRERVKTALLAKRFSDGEHIIVRRGFCSSETIARDLADAAIAAILGGEGV